MAPTHPIRTDLIVQTATGDMLALVEIKNRMNLTPEIAATLRRNLIAHGRVNWLSKYFLIVSQDVGYLWDQRTLQPADAMSAALPTVEFPMAPVVRRYLPSFADNGRLSGSHLELAVIQLLADLANGVDDRPRESEIALEGTDFPRLIRGGRVGAEIDI